MAFMSTDNLKKITMADVAREAGVSTMTVSRALNKANVVSAATLSKIQKAVDDLGYVLDQSAGSLSSRKTGFVAAIIPSINNSNFSETAHGITKELEKNGLQLLLGYTDYMQEREEELVESLLRRRPEGIIVTGGYHTDKTRRMLHAAAIPVVEMWDLPKQPIQHVVGFSNSRAIEKLVEHLYKEGYRSFCYLGGDDADDTRGQDRLHGYQNQLKKYGLNHERVVEIGQTPLSYEDGSRGIKIALEKWPQTDVIVCVSDLMAFGALVECQRSGWNVPRDIAIAGFGDYELSRNCYPEITTINVDCFGIGSQAAQIICQQIQSHSESEFSNKIIKQPIHILPREST
ncbi:LacI family DNA-binding transcriptional regulator [Polycladidibacter stylochi]|uniref:LacI family DNA-binding transcriptional regulator n=1 Tax=Polycladidibacter stylochi TaxID=1807766 RepID=UPI00082B47B8|nr:LacI family DNA-binding transcriptional regulator [Pseudovibrio stylochi]